MSDKGVRSIRGVHDIIPDEQGVWRPAIAAAVRLAELYGYRRLDTPIIETAELFERGVGETSDVVQREMYRFQDRGGRWLVLRPEATSSAVRAYFERGLADSRRPARLYGWGPMFRFDRPQAGRYRQFHQFDLEVIGEAGAQIDAEAIEILWRWLEGLGLTSVSLQLNSIGDKVCRPGYRTALVDYYRPLVGELCHSCVARLDANPLRLLDCKEAPCQPHKLAAPRTLDHLCSECQEHFDAVRWWLDARRIPYSVNWQLVRGLDYYTRTVFEVWHSDLQGAQNALGSGGRYDDLASTLGWPDTPGVGWAAGLERVVAMTQAPGGRGSGPSDPNWVVVLAIDPKQAVAAWTIADGLRRAGINCTTELSSRSLKAKLRSASSTRAGWVVIVGQDEMDVGQVIVRDMAAGDQQRIAEGDLTVFLTRALSL